MKAPSFVRPKIMAVEDQVESMEFLSSGKKEVREYEGEELE